MKAIIYTEYGPPEVLKLVEVDKPTPKRNEVLIRIYATTIGYGDIFGRNMRNISPGKFAMPLLFWLIAKISFGIRKPRNKILGSQFSGVIEAVGENVTPDMWKVGDQVFGYTSSSMKAYAEYIVLPEDKILSQKPANMSFEEAAVVPYGGIMALTLLRDKVNLKPGQKILINGASGGIGSAIVQLAKSHFDVNVTGVCGTPRLDFVKSLGADQVIDYTVEDFTESSETYDLIFGGLGRTPFSKVKNSLNPNGRYVLTSFKMRQVGQMLRTKLFGNKKVNCVVLPEKSEDLRALKELIEEGKLKAIIDKSFPFEQMAEAHRYVEEGRHKGHVVITVEPNNT
ncbi:MAG: NAD(P)-dependent alcohol dehydrogenase [Candidatus Heimdallarchaeota archaeon]|nr:MAG: NAD(P)-dependent alcohol dehydrogenase [Candidatus Heimdallarchaeota archaeon]